MKIRKIAGPWQASSSARGSRAERGEAGSGGRTWRTFRSPWPPEPRARLRPSARACAASVLSGAGARLPSLIWERGGRREATWPGAQCFGHKPRSPRSAAGPTSFQSPRFSTPLLNLRIRFGRTFSPYVLPVTRRLLVKMAAWASSLWGAGQFGQGHPAEF